MTRIAPTLSIFQLPDSSPAVITALAQHNAIDMSCLDS
jgi:hypothetical protein